MKVKTYYKLTQYSILDWLLLVAEEPLQLSIKLKIISSVMVPLSIKLLWILSI